jgi:Calcineurin-like phosphoesterase
LYPRFSANTADRRLILAALDKPTQNEFRDRLDLTHRVRPDAEGAMWLDYVSDLGEGFDSTYAIAYLLAQDSIEIDGHLLPRGEVLVMGGDQVYPTATRDNYSLRMQHPYWMASPTRDHQVPLYLIPGNHDWYDGLVLFLAKFCREKPTEIGDWVTRQRRMQRRRASLSIPYWPQCCL